MTNLLLGLAANAAAFVATIVVLPGIILGGASDRFLTILLIGSVAAVETVVPHALQVRRTQPRLLLVAVGALATSVLLLAASAALRTTLKVGVSIGDFPRTLGLRELAALAAGAVAMSVVPVALVAVGRWKLPLRALTLARPQGRPSAILVIFLVSGAAGLIYEVVWARQLVLVFGNTTQAVSAILTGYFGGIAIGSIAGGRIADRVRSPLRLYGFLELALVVIVLLTPTLFRGLHEVYRSGYASLENTPTALALTRYLLALLALAPATILMGATLPTLSRHLARDATTLSAHFGRLYAANTIGAVVGTAVSGLVLIEVFGLTATLAIGAVGSGAAGLAALVLAHRAQLLPRAEAPPVQDPANRPDSVSEAGGAPANRRPMPRLAIVIAFVSGLTSLGYQVLWNRLLSSGSGNSTYVFVLILTVFLVGIACGAAYFARRLTGARRSLWLLGICQLAVAAIAMAGIPIVNGALVSLPIVLRVIVVVLPATLVMGVTLPMAAGLIGRGKGRVGSDSGALLGANTLGAICGTFLVPFAFIPAIGSPRTVIALAVLNAVLGIVLVVRDTTALVSLRRWGALVGAGILVVAIVAPTLGSTLLVDPGEVLMRRSSTLLASAEDEIASVQAGIRANVPRLFVAGTGMTTITVDAKLMPLLPLMLRPASGRTLVIAFGMGSTYRAALRAGLEVDGVELVPSVPRMFGYYYPDAAAVLADPKGHLHITDGRNFVELSDRTYDAVVVDPPPPIESSGTAVLYSREFYGASAARLNAGGVMMEWMPYGQTIDEFRAHVRTFASVFPNVILGFGPTHRGVYMLGSNAPMTLDRAAIRSVLERPGVLDDLVNTIDAPTSSEDAWVDIVARIPWLSGPMVERFAGQGPLITDDHPLTEYYLLRHLFGPASPNGSEASLRAAAPSP